ncbi:MAG: heavy-metal-associated domain-containing protein [Flavobacteriia bacterium]|nr:heavy-metal-associated domain-containing protein [Flavobacteriia bacterium]
MKTKKNVNGKVKQVLLLLMMVFSTMTLFSQEKDQNKKQTAIIKTSAECDMCKERIESKLNYTKGVSFAELDFKSKELTVKFKTDKITLEEIKKILSELGYDADDVKANPEAAKLLPTCCQPGGMK